MIFFTLITFIVSIIIIWKNNIKSNGIFYPPIFFSILIILGFVIPVPFVLSLGDSNPFYLFWNYNYDNFEMSIIKAEISAILSLLSFLIGFNIVKMPTNKNSYLKLNVSYNDLVFKCVFLLFLLLSLLSFIFIINKFGGLTNYFSGNENRVKAMAGLNIIPLIQNCFAGLFIYWYYINRFECTRVQFISFFLLTLFFLSFNNSKAPIFVLFTALFIIYHYFIKRVPIFKILIGSFLFIFLFIFWELVFREYFVLGEFASYNSDINVSDNLIFKFGEFYTGNFMQVQTVSIIMDSFPSKIPFFYGSSILMILFIWIPSVIFPNKPLTGAGEFTLAIWPEKYFKNGTTLPPGLIGELYLNFSWIGIIIGMALIGYFYGRLWRKFKFYENNLMGTVNFIIFISLLLHFFRGELSSPLLMAIFLIIPGFIVNKISIYKE